MTVELQHIPPNDRKSLVENWAQRRAVNSENPFQFTRAFEATLNQVAAGGELELLEDRWESREPTRVAAEIEALAAARALRRWGSNAGLYVRSRRAQQKKIWRSRAA